MQLHTIHRKHPYKAPRARIGRGGKRGTTSGRGQKGQKSRAGHRIRPAERDLIQRLPKLRGVKNPVRRLPAQTVRVGDLARVGTDTISRKNLAEKHLIKWPSKRPVKILAGGKVTKAFTIERVPISAGARRKIEEAGGKIIP